MRVRSVPGIIDSVVDEAGQQRAETDVAKTAAAQQAGTEPDVTEPPPPAKAKRAVMRIPGAAVVAIFLLTIGMTPIAWTVPGLLVLYVIPAALLYWVLRVRTTATPDGLAIRGLFDSRRLSWEELRGLSIGKHGKVSAVTTDGATVALPAVRGQNLPALSLISGGRLPDPTGLTTELNTEQQ